MSLPTETTLASSTIVERAAFTSMVLLRLSCGHSVWVGTYPVRLIDDKFDCPKCRRVP
ncbi:MAG: hypothetical protein ACHREM_00390 [Polyangiales bacterium]